MSRRTGRGGRPRHGDHHGGPRPHDPTRPSRPTIGPPSGPLTLPPSTTPLVAPVDEPAGAPIEARREGFVEPGPVMTAASVGPANGVSGNGVHQATGPVAVDHPAPGEPIELDADGGSLTPLPAPVEPVGPTPSSVGAGEPDRADGPPRLDARTERPPAERSGSCTTAQLRRFIKSRAYVPMHEIRRRFLIVSEDDDVTGLSIEDGGRIFVGLPEREGLMLGELFRSGEIGYELQLDPRTPVVVGVYPMRPVSRT